MQYDLFQNENEILFEQNKKSKKDLNTLRRGMFAQMRELQKSNEILAKQIDSLSYLYDALKDDFERVEQMLLRVKK